MSAPGRERDTDADRPSVRTIVAVGIAVAVVVIAFLLAQPRTPSSPEPIPAPDAPGVGEAGPALETVAPADSAAQRGDTARELIATLRADPEGVDYATAYERALAFADEGRAADAQLLLFFAARGGHAPAAFELAAQYDPNGFDAASSLAAEPDPFQAYQWYREADAGGHAEAADRLVDLRRWAEQAAAEDAAAERLLLQWEGGE